MLPFDILSTDDCMYSFEPASLMVQHKRWVKGLPRNEWEKALTYIQENDAPQTIFSICDTLDHILILRYCAAHVLLEKRAILLNPSRIDDWYMLLDSRTAFDNFDGPDFYPHSLGRLRTLYGIEWLHARAMQYTPLQHVWFAGHYWPTLWSASTFPPVSIKKSHGHNMERWSFSNNQWHIQQWICEPQKTSSDPYSYYTSQIASPVLMQRALSRTLLLKEDNRVQAWDSIPFRLRASCLLDWALSEPMHDCAVMPYLCKQLGADSQNLSIRLDLARNLGLSGSTIVQSLANGDEPLPLPLN